MIRPATLDDWSEVDRMAAAFQAQVPWVSYRPATLLKRYASLVQDDGGFVRVLDMDGVKGVLVAGTTPSFFDEQILVAQEVMWWHDPGARALKWSNAMLDAFEAWIKDVGAHVGGMACFDDRTAKLLKRRGYLPTEQVFRVP